MEKRNDSQDGEEIDNPSLQEIPTDLLKIKTDQNVEEYFQLFLNKLFPIIKKTIVGNTVVLIMINYYKQKFYIRHKLTDFEDQFSRDAFLDLNCGLFPIILRHKKPLLENHLPESENLIPYYTSSNLPAKSFLGVPLLFEDYIVGILCVDSAVEESFSDEDLQILNEFSKVLSIQLASSNRLYEYEAENWTTRLLYDFSKGILDIPTKEELWPYLSSLLKTVFGADRVIIAEKEKENTGKIVYLSGKESSFNTNDEFANNEGIMGWVLRKNQSLLVDDFSSKENYIPRFRLNEPPSKEFKSLLAVPVSRNDQTLAVISIESQKAFKFKEQHKKILETMSYQIASFLDKARMLSQLREQNLIDPKTRLWNQKAFLVELDKEISRCREYQRKFCVQLLKLGTPNANIAPDISDQLMLEFLSFILPLMKKTNYIFKFDNNSIVILWPEKAVREVLSDFKPFTEKIVQKRPWLDGMVEKVYINSGVVQYPQMGENASVLVENAKYALERAEQKGQNTIEVYQEIKNTNTQES